MFSLYTKHAYFKRALKAALLSVLTYNAYCSNNIERAVSAVNTQGTFSYSVTKLSYGLPNCVLTLVQSPGMRSYLCQTPTGMDNGSVCISMQLSNRFGSRFSNNHHGQLVLQVICQYLNDMYCTNKWSKTDMLSTIGFGVPVNNYRMYLTATTSGPTVTVVCSSSIFLSAFTLFKTILTDIYNSNMSDSDVDDACTNMNALVASSLVNASKTGNPIGNKDISWYLHIQPKWDCSHQYGGASIGDSLGIPVGSFESFSYLRTSLMIGSQPDRDRAKLCLSLFRREKDLAFFIASSDPTILTQLPTGMKLISDQFGLTQTVVYSKLYYGYPLPKGGRLIFSRPEDPDRVTGGTIFLGPISCDSIIASQLIVKLATNSVITNNAYPGYLGITMMPLAGQMTVRASSHIGSLNPMLPPWATFISNIKTRYANGAHSSDCTNTDFQSEIQVAYNKLVPSNSHPTDEGLYDTVLSANNSGYVNWMQLFQGSLKSMSDLQAIASGTPLDKANALQRAIAIITTKADTSITCETDYMPT